MYSVKSRSGRRGTVLTNYAHDMTRLMLRAPISWFSSGPVSNVKMGRNVRQAVLGYGFGVRGRKVKSRDCACALASDLIRLRAFALLFC